MSRVGKQLLSIPQKTEVNISEREVRVKGPLGELVRTFRPEDVAIAIDNNVVKLTPKRDTKISRSLWGTYASHIKSMIEGVNKPFEKKLVLERTAGIMLSGRKIGGGFGYDIFYGNPAGRGSASVTKAEYEDSGTGDVLATGATTGSENTTVVRVMYDMGRMMHMELAVGKEDGGSFNVTDSVLGDITVSAEDYEVMDFGFRFKSGPMTVKFEWIDGENVKGVSGNDESVYFLHYGHMITKKIELVARYYNADQSSDSQADRDLQNTFLGANFFLGSNKTNGRLQVNYVVVGGDDIDSSTGTYNGAAKGFTDDAVLTQYQMSF